MYQNKFFFLMNIYKQYNENYYHIEQELIYYYDNIQFFYLKIEKKVNIL